jgi:hypothetical protein
VGVDIEGKMPVFGGNNGYFDSNNAVSAASAGLMIVPEGKGLLKPLCCQTRPQTRNHLWSQTLG